MQGPSLDMRKCDRLNLGNLELDVMHPINVGPEMAGPRSKVPEVNERKGGNNYAEQLFA